MICAADFFFFFFCPDICVRRPGKLGSKSREGKTASSLACARLAPHFPNLKEIIGTLIVRVRERGVPEFYTPKNAKGPFEKTKGQFLEIAPLKSPFLPFASIRVVRTIDRTRILFPSFANDRFFTRTRLALRDCRSLEIKVEGRRTSCGLSLCNIPVEHLSHTNTHTQTCTRKLYNSLYGHSIAPRYIPRDSEKLSRVAARATYDRFVVSHSLLFPVLPTPHSLSIEIFARTRRNFPTKADTLPADSIP